MTQPSVTVIMAAYNAARTVGSSISSVLVQDHPNVEVVVVDDGSADGTARVVQGYVDAGLPVRLVTQPNGGCANARNTALRHADGDLIAYLDADDELLPGFFEAGIAAIEDAGDGRTWASMDAFLLTAGGLDPKRTVLHYGNPRPDQQVRAILETNFVSGFSLFPRAMIDEVGPFRPELPTCEDWDLWTRAIVQGWRVRLVERPLALYRWTPGSMSSSIDNMARGEMMVLENVRAHLADKLTAEDRAYLDERIEVGSLGALRQVADDALRAGDIRAAREAYRTVARTSPTDRRSVVKAKTLGNPVGDLFWTRRLRAADAATRRESSGR